MRKVLANVAVGILIAILFAVLLVGSILAVLPYVAVLVDSTDNVFHTIDSNLVRFYQTHHISWQPDLNQIILIAAACGLTVVGLSVVMDNFILGFDAMDLCFCFFLPVQGLYWQDPRF